MTKEAENKGAENMNYSRVLHVERAVDDNAARDTLIALMKDRAPDPSIFENSPFYFFNGQISSSVWDSYDTRMGQTTLQNYAREAAIGVAFLRGHRSYSTDPIGQSLTGAFVGGQGNGVARVTSDWYVVSDPDSEIFVNRMRSGAIRDLSVGFYGGEWICSICNKDMEQWMSRDGCRHYLGMLYTPRDESGMPTGEPEKARATIENAHLSEYSGVFRGATPGCMIAKARAMALDGSLRGQERELVEVRYKLTLPAYAKPFPGAALPNDSTTDARSVGNLNSEDNMNELETLRQQVADVRAALTLAGIATDKPLDAAVRGLAESLKAATADGGTLGGIRKHLTRAGVNQEITAIEDGARLLADECLRLKPLADDGTAYRVALVDDAEKEGIRAFGTEYKKEAQRTLLESLPPASVKELRDSWRAIGDKLFSGKRNTEEDAGEPPAARQQPDIPEAAYRN